MTDAPSAQREPGMPTFEYVETNGIKLKTYTAGPDDGFPIVLCHGWPEMAYSWRHQIKALAEAGLKVIAPNMRGYDGSPGPDEVEAYDMEHLTADLVGLLDHYGYEKAVFVGHDWGGFITWQMPLRHADRTAGVIGLNTPFIPRLSDDPIKLFTMGYGEKFYIIRMQEPGKIDALLNNNVERFFKMVMRRSDVTPEEFNARPAEERDFDLFRPLELPESEDVNWTGTGFLSDEEMQVFVEAYKRSGSTGGINWYRNFTRNWERSADQVDKVDCPCLMIGAARDVVLPPSLMDGMEKYVPNLTKHVVEDSGHWTQQEQPEEVNEVMIDWLNKRFWT